jgi:hypothetical protein
MSKWTTSSSSLIKSQLLVKVTGIKIKTSQEIKIEEREEIMANNSNRTQVNKINKTKVSNLDTNLKMLDQDLSKTKENARVKIIKNSDS